MKAMACVVAMGLAGVAGAALADEVTCESKGKAQTSCDMDTRGEVRLVRQLSKSACTEGVSWGLSKHSVWVSNGCRAVFSSGAGDPAPGPTAGVKAGLPLVNAECPGGNSVHIDEGGPVYVNGKQAQLKRFNDNYYEASYQGVKYSVSKNADGTASISYTGPGQANGVCQTTNY